MLELRRYRPVPHMRRLFFLVLRGGRINGIPPKRSCFFILLDNKTRWILRTVYIDRAIIHFNLMGVDLLIFIKWYFAYLDSFSLSCLWFPYILRQQSRERGVYISNLCDQYVFSLIYFDFSTSFSKFANGIGRWFTFWRTPTIRSARLHVEHFDFLLYHAFFS